MVSNLMMQHLRPEHQMIMFIVPRPNEAHLYMNLKKVSMDIGLPSQCIRSKLLSESYYCLSPMVVRIVAQINAKLGGQLWGVVGVGFN